MLKFINVWCNDVDMFTATITNYKITDANIALQSHLKLKLILLQ